MKRDTLRDRIIARAIAQVNRMSGDELLAFINRPLFRSEQRPGCATQYVVAHAVRRLDALTS